MKEIKLRGVLIAVAGALAAGAAAPAMADSGSDIIYALMAKGVLTEEEGHQLLDGRDKEVAEEKKKSAGSIKVGNFIDNATLYGDIRVRAEHRDGKSPVGTNPANAAASSGTGSGVSEDRDRGRYKLTFGVKTEASDFYADLGFAMGAGGRSDNATFGGGGSNGGNNKETLFVKRAMVGWKMADWITVEAGRTANPLYTTPMVWDGDLTFEGLNEQLKFKAGRADVFLTFVQSQYLGDKKNFSDKNGTNGDANNNFLLAFQGGAKFKITEDVSAKAALTYTTYTHDKTGSSGVTSKAFTPGLGDTRDALGSNLLAINDLRTIEVPWEVNMKGSGALTYTVFGDFVHNLDGNDRADAAYANATGATKAAIRAAGNDSNAWMLGAGLKSAQGKKAQKGDWSAKLWYQDVGMYSVDPNGVDSDFMDSRVNMKGVVFKGEYLVRDNVFFNFAAGHATRKEDKLSAAGNGGDIGLNLDKYNLYQLDLTYKF